LAAGKKNAARLGAHIVFADESGFLLIPHVAKTWAPLCQTPVIHQRYRRDKISVISGVSASPKRQPLGLFYQLYFQNIGQEEVCAFLRHLLPHLQGPVIALLDNSRTHHGEPLQELLRQHSRLRIDTSRPTRQNSIPTKGCGRSPSATSPTAVPMRSRNWCRTSSVPSIGFAPRQRNYGDASFNPNSPRFYANGCIIYAEINNGGFTIQ
jgi:hypothetical protein